MASSRHWNGPLWSKSGERTYPAARKTGPRGSFLAGDCLTMTDIHGTSRIRKRTSKRPGWLETTTHDPSKGLPFDSLALSSPHPLSKKSHRLTRIRNVHCIRKGWGPRILSRTQRIGRMIKSSKKIPRRKRPKRANIKKPFMLRNNFSGMFVALLGVFDEKGNAPGTRAHVG